MRIVCVYREGYDYSRSVSDFIENFYRRTGHRIEEIDPDREPGFCETYDIVEYPTILALGPNGEVANVWKGQDLPLFDEVMYYYNS